MKDPAEIEESYRYKYIEEWYIHICGSAKGVAVIITMIVLFIGGTCVLTYFGLPFWYFYCFMPMSGFTVCGKPREAHILQSTGWCKMV